MTVSTPTFCHSTTTTLEQRNVSSYKRSLGWPGCQIPKTPGQSTEAPSCNTQYSKDLPTPLRCYTPLNHRYPPHIFAGTFQWCPVKFVFWEFWGPVPTLNSLPHSSGRSWVVFVVWQHVLSCIGNHCHTTGVQVPFGVCLVVKGVWGRCLCQPRECQDRGFHSRTAF